MACACKAVKKNKEKIYDNASGTIRSRGLKFYLDFLFRKVLLNRVFMSVLIFALCVILFPIIIIVLIFTQITTGEAKIVLPKKFLNITKQDGE